MADVSRFQTSANGRKSDALAIVWKSKEQGNACDVEEIFELWKLTTATSLEFNLPNNWSILGGGQAA